MYLQHTHLDFLLLSTKSTVCAGASIGNGNMAFLSDVDSLIWGKMQWREKKSPGGQYDWVNSTCCVALCLCAMNDGMGRVIYMYANWKDLLTGPTSPVRLGVKGTLNCLKHLLFFWLFPCPCTSQEYDKQLGASAVAYINLDAAIKGVLDRAAEDCKLINKWAVLWNWVIAGFSAFCYLDTTNYFKVVWLVKTFNPTIK